MPYVIQYGPDRQNRVSYYGYSHSVDFLVRRLEDALFFTAPWEAEAFAAAPMSATRSVCEVVLKDEGGGVIFSAWNP